MKNVFILLLSVFIAIMLFPVKVLAADFGPDEWHQYRMNSDKNAVYENGSDPLNFTTFQTANEVRATPVVVGNKLFIGNHESGDLYAFDIHTGEELWHNEAPNWIHSEMIYHEGAVYVGVGNRYVEEEGLRGTDESGVFAYDAETGEELWKYNTGGEVMPTPIYYNDSVYAVTGDMHLYKLDSETGEMLHKEELNRWVSMSAPAVENDTLFTGGGGDYPFLFTAYDLKFDEIKWQTKFPDVLEGLDDVPPAVHDNIVVTTALEMAENEKKPEHFMYALDTDTGDILWKESLGVGDPVKNNKSGAPMIYENKIYVGSPITKTFYAYDLKTGKKLWDFENEMIKAPPVAKDGIVYFSNLEGFVYALDAETGEETGKVEVGQAIAPAGPVIINETMFMGSQDSYVYAVPLTDFEQNGEEHKVLTMTPSDEGFTKSDYIIYSILGVFLIGIIVILVINLRKSKNK